MGGVIIISSTYGDLRTWISLKRFRKAYIKREIHDKLHYRGEGLGQHRSLNIVLYMVKSVYHLFRILFYGVKHSSTNFNFSPPICS